VEPLPGTRTLVDITTGTGDFIANGVVSHNCYARPTHEYLGLSAGLDFETKIWVKEDAPELLARELASPRWKPKVLVLSGVTDPYQPVEKRLGLTRRVLEVLARFRNPVAVITKNHLVTRDADLLAELAAVNAAMVYFSITTLDEELRPRLEPRTSSPRRRLEAMERLAARGIPTGVMMAPIIPGLTEPEIPSVLTAAARAGAQGAGYTVLRLPYQVAPLFEAWLETHFPQRKEKVLNRIRAIRGGRLNDPRFGSRMHGEGFYADEIERLFKLARRRAGLVGRSFELSADGFRVPGARQGDLFDGAT
jgi:DNA repair photolyase